MSGPSVQNKSKKKVSSIEVSEVDLALAGSSQLAHDPNEGVVERELVILQDGTTLDLTAHIAAAVKRVIAELPVSSLVGFGTQGSGSSVDTHTRARKRPHEVMRRKGLMQTSFQLNCSALLIKMLLHPPFQILNQSKLSRILDEKWMALPYPRPQWILILTLLRQAPKIFGQIRK